MTKLSPAPSLTEVTRHLVAKLKWMLREGIEDCDVRLQLQESGDWQLHFGALDYDVDRSGFGADGLLNASPDATDAELFEEVTHLAGELIDDALEHAAQCDVRFQEG